MNDRYTDIPIPVSSTKVNPIQLLVDAGIESLKELPDWKALSQSERARTVSRMKSFIRHTCTHDLPKLGEDTVDWTVDLTAAGGGKFRVRYSFNPNEEAKVVSDYRYNPYSLKGPAPEWKAITGVEFRRRMAVGTKWKIVYPARASQDDGLRTVIRHHSTHIMLQKSSTQVIEGPSWRPHKSLRHAFFETSAGHLVSAAIEKYPEKNNSDDDMTYLEYAPVKE